MTTSSITATVDADDLATLIAGKVKTTRTSVLTFVDFTPFMTELLKIFYKPGARLIASGHVTPEVELAADRAEIELVETLGY